MRLHPIGTKVRIINTHSDWSELFGRETTIKEYTSHEDADYVLDFELNGGSVGCKHSSVEPIIKEKGKEHNQVREWDDCAWKPDIERIL